MTELLTVDQVAAAAQVNPRTVLRAIEGGTLRAHNVARPGARRATWRISPEEFAAWLDLTANVSEPCPRPVREAPADVPAIQPAEAPTGRRPRNPRKPTTGRLVA